MEVVTRADWLYLFDGPFAQSNEWAAEHASDPAAGWDACPRADWLIAAAALAGVSGAEVIRVLHTVVSSIVRARAEAGAPFPGADWLARALDVADAWVDERADGDEVARFYGEVETADDAPALARALASATLCASNGADLLETRNDDFSLVYCSTALSLHAGNAVNAVAPTDHLQSLVAKLVREHLAWETVADAVANSEVSRRRRVR